MKTYIVALLQAYRPKQWYKNTVIFVPLIFSENLFNPNLFIDSLIAFILFSLMASSIYILNDIIDIDSDKNHPKKKYRSIASGKIGKNLALSVSLIQAIIVLVVSYYINFLVFLCLLIYMIMNIFYSFVIKYIAYLDVVIISSFFSIRTLSGVFVINVPISTWVMVCSFLLPLLLSLGKRYKEFLLMKENSFSSRPVLEDYNENTIEQLILLSSTSLLIVYTIYTVLEVTNVMTLTVPFVFFGIAKYLHNLNSTDFGEDPEEIFTDKIFTLNLFFYVLAVFLILYFDFIYK